MILLSTGEAHSLSCIEGLAAGLGLVISEFATANLDTDKPFITVIPEEKVHDVDYLREKIEENREVSLASRLEIRQYAIDNFDWPNIINKYEKILNGRH
jgi:glycosyltransferase involved in cell wall biosynthesis